MEKYILLVDDEETILKALTRELEDWASDQVITLVTMKIS